jgi:hypothetical protein
MAAVDTIQLPQNTTTDAARRKFSQAVWEYYRMHQNDVVYTVAGFFKVRVKHLRKLFEQIAGYEREAE